MLTYECIESPNDEILQDDLELIANSNIPFNELNNRKVLVTGATGLIGSQLVKALSCCNRLHNTNIKIIALARSVEKAKAIFGNMLEHPDLKLILGDVTKPVKITEDIDYIIHTASVTSSKDFVTYPVETIQTVFEGTRNLLELAKDKHVKAFVYLSSLEVYGVTDPSLKYVTEKNYGYIDILDSRSSYSEGKRIAECLCISYEKEYGVPVKIARLTQTFGAGVKYDDGRVFAQFARSVIEKKNIVLHTSGDTVRSYCYTRDALRALIFILLKGEKGQAYNVANMDTVISIRDMAEMLSKEFPEAGIKVVYDITEDIQKFGYNPTVKINLDTAKLQKLGWKAELGIKEMYRRTIDSMKKQYQQNNCLGK
ncbi:MAG TPA: NAD-dependent epimerase/dehydratase family protein [Clostridia bacterium]|nr:NAD-dependent epimerase/dehydratase family protein [Clostridia bacterium]